jgi:hypothetical protein
METKLFWQLLEDVCQLGEFIVGIETNGADINIVGRFQVAYDGFENVLEKQDCKDHFHLVPDKIQAIRFGYHEVTTGGLDPCIEPINLDGQACLILMYYPYQANEPKPKHEEFMAQHRLYKDLLTGEW